MPRTPRRAPPAVPAPVGASSVQESEATPETSPKKSPKAGGKLRALPIFFYGTAIPRPAHAGPGGAPLERWAVEDLGRLLAAAARDHTPGPLRAAREACEPASLGAFAWGLCAAWIVAGAPVSELWALYAVGHLGDDVAARKLAREVARWPGESAHARAGHGLLALVLLGTPAALRELERVAEDTRYPTFRTRALDAVRAAAQARGMTPEQLGDLLVPDFDLTGPGGTRAIAFIDGEYPQTPARDEWTALRAGLEDVVPRQVRRFERAMCVRRRWGAAEFHRAVLGHALLRVLARGLVWGTYGAAGALAATFRVTDDGSLADEHDRAFALESESASAVGLPHAIELDGALVARWSAVFGDYKLLQPFAQLGRAVHRVPAGQAGADALRAFEGRVVPTEVLYALEAAGWRRGASEGHAIVRSWSRALDPETTAALRAEPGIDVSEATLAREQTLGAVRFDRAGVALALGAVHPVPYSEAVRDLGDVIDGAAAKR